MCVCVIIKEEGGKERSTLHWVCVCVVCALGKHQKGRRKGGKTRKLKEGKEGGGLESPLLYFCCLSRPASCSWKEGGEKEEPPSKEFLQNCHASPTLLNIFLAKRNPTIFLFFFGCVCAESC